MDLGLPWLQGFLAGIGAGNNSRIINRVYVDYSDGSSLELTEDALRQFLSELNALLYTFNTILENRKKKEREPAITPTLVDMADLRSSIALPKKDQNDQ